MFPLVLTAQVTIGTGVAPDENALLDLKTETDGSANKGFLPPRVSLVALNSPQPITSGDLTESIIVYNTNESVGGRGLYYWKNKQWNNMSSTNDNTWYQSGTTETSSTNTEDIYHQGKIGIGVNTPTNQLHVKGTNPVKIEGLSTGNFTTSSILSTNASNVVEKIPSSTIVSNIAASIASTTSIPVPNVYTLSADINSFLSTASAGNSQVMSGLTETKATISGMTFTPSTSTIYFPPGTYQIFVVYEALHNATGCTISSYFVDFPTEDVMRRVHSTASHVQGSAVNPISNHGGTVVYSVTLKKGVNWTASLGRGQSGNCTGAGMTLKALSTQILIFRIGD